MDRQQFEEHVESGDGNEYVDREALEFFADNAPMEIVEKSALQKSEIDQTEFVSVALPTSGESVSDDELRERVYSALVSPGADIQKYQLRDGKTAADRIEIQRHGHGYSAFAFASE